MNSIEAGKNVWLFVQGQWEKIESSFFLDFIERLSRKKLSVILFVSLFLRLFSFFNLSVDQLQLQKRGRFWLNFRHGLGQRIWPVNAYSLILHNQWISIALHSKCQALERIKKRYCLLAFPRRIISRVSIAKRISKFLCFK